MNTSWLTPAAVSNLIGTSIMTLVFIHLYYQERQRFLGIWAASWGIYTLRFLFLLGEVLDQSRPVYTAGYQLASLFSGILLLWGSHQFLGRPVSRHWLILVGGIAIWATLAVWAGFTFIALTAPTFLFLCFAYVWTGMAFLRHPNLPATGKALLGWSFIVWGLHKADYPFVRPLEWAAPYGYMLSAVLELLVAFGLLMLYFQITKNELRRNEAYFRAIFDHAPMGIGLMEPDGHFRQLNPRALEMLGYSGGEIQDKTPRELIVPQDNDEVITRLSTKETGEIDHEHLERRVQRKDGSAFWADLAFSTVRSPSGKAENIIAVITDISKRMDAEQALQRKTRQQEKLIETARRLPETLELSQVLEQIARGAQQIIDAYGTAIFLLDEDRQTLIPVVALHPDHAQEILAVRANIENSLTGEAVKQGRGLIFNDVAGLTEGYPVPGMPDLENENVIVAPLIVGESVLGAIWLNRLGPGFVEEDTSLVETFASFAATSLKNAQTHDKLQKEIQERIQAEGALRAMEDRFKIAFRISPDSININRLRDGLYIDVNEGYTALTGYTKEDVQDKTSIEINIWNDPQDRARLVEGLKKDGVVRNLEAKFRMKDGRVRTGLMSATVLSLADEPHILSITRDIEERKLAELALQESEQRYRSLFENRHTAMWIVDPATCRILDANPAACEYYGYSKEELTGMTLMDINTNPTDLLEELKNAGDEVSKHYVLTHRLASGEERQVEAYTGRFMEAGEKRLFTIIHDVTERIQREREMEAILQVATALRIAPTRAQMFPVILKQVQTLLQAEEARLSLYDPIKLATIFEEKVGDLEDATQTNNFAGVPLVWQEKSIGSLTINRSAPITDADIRILSAVSEIAANALQRASLFEETQRNLERLNALHTIDVAITGNSDLKDTLEVILAQVASQLRVSAVDILVLDTPSQPLTCAAAYGLLGDPTGSTLNLWGSRAGKAILENRLICLPDPEGGDRDLTSSDVLPGTQEYPYYFAVPLIAKESVQGVMELYSRTEISLDHEWLGFLDTLARQTAIALDNAFLLINLEQTNADLTQAYDTTLEGWARALELRDRDTGEHTKRLVELTLALARRMGFDEDQITHLRRGALLHDIGKMGIPDGILTKPGPLNEAEWEIMRKHPVYAYELLSGISYLKPSLDIPHLHHERWDGSGYPYGLKGEQIPLAARIFAVADVWDALSSDRPYRLAWPRPQVESYLREQSGVQFDPQVVQVFFEYLKEAG
jgi:PAS domain S-box-containing protein